MLFSADNHVFPCWAPEWLRGAVESPDCSSGTHPCLRRLAKWLTIYFAEHDGEAERWLRHAALRCARDVDEGEVDRLLVWAEGRFGHAEAASTTRVKGASTCGRPQVDLEQICQIALRGPRLAEYREGSPERLCGSSSRNTEEILQAWSCYAGELDPWISFGSRDQFWTRRFSAVRDLLHVHEQIVPSPMKARFGKTADGHWSEHSKEGTGERMFLVVEFDFAKVSPKGKPTIWRPLLEQCESSGISVLDLNAALLARLSIERPLWMTVFSGGKSLQGWFPCRGVAEEELQRWFIQSASQLGADPMTFCKSQFVRMPDGTRAPNREGKSVRQSIEYYDPSVL